MSTTRSSNGLAFTPDKDLKLFADMARRGQRLSGVSLTRHGWKFDDAEPEEVIFDLAYQANPTTEYFEIFRAAGWTRVLSYGDIHFFKAPAGTAPVHTSIESRLEEMTSNRDKFLRYSAVTGAIFALVLVGLAVAGWPRPHTVMLVTACLVPLVYTVFPLAGYSWHLLRLRRSHPAA